MSYLSQDLKPRTPRATPQSQPIPGSTQTRNLAGGYAWEVSDWDKLDRFLILGTEGGTYYASGRKLTKMHTEALERCLKEDGLRVVDRIVEVSVGNLAPKNDPALYALALASAKGDEVTRAHALEALPQVARTATHLFDFLTFRQAFGGWGRGLRRAVSAWYLDRSADSLALQLVKYRQRNGWTHRDVLRKAHPDAGRTLHGEGVVTKQRLLRWAVKGIEGVDYPHRLVQGYEMAQRSPNAKVTAGLVKEYVLPREALLTEHLNSREVWEALLTAGDFGMPIHALIRNLATMTRAGVIRPMSEDTTYAVNRLVDKQALEKGRVHPMALLIAMATYAQGRGERGTNTWTPVPQVIDALDRAFYLSFPYAPTTGKRIVIGLDVSGSMHGTQVVGVPGMDCRQAAAAVALVTAATEPNTFSVAFDTQPYPLTISGRERLDDVVRLLKRTGGGGTDCSAPIRYAIENRIPVDAFVIYTDSETWYGRQHPAQAIREYRKRMNIPAKLVVVAMASSGATIADPADGGMMNVVGLDASAPNLISQFIAD